MDDIEPPEGEMIVAVAAGITGVPLYLTRDSAGCYLSFEHTHPPAELIIAGGRWEWQQAMRAYWLNMAPQ